MNLNKAIKAVFITLGMISTFKANASVTYTYTDSNDPRFTGNVVYSGAFSVDSTLADGSYHFATTAAQPAGFKESFFSAPFIDGSGATRTPSLSVFDITISNGLLSAWDIQATTPFTRVSYSGGKVQVPTYHNSVVIFHDSTANDFQTFYDVAIPYQISVSGLVLASGNWTIASTPAVSAVPLPPSVVMFAAALIGSGVFRRKNPTK